ncbi:MAG: hypothetical protein DRJ37_00705 [Thermoprotei archaeon]|nr:MAG: hypothetical protein DRJ37_00705 [Thermoprotei archaeon]
MLRVCLTSGCKGGTGKSTISILLTVLYAGVGKRVILVDTGVQGNSSHMILSAPPPPYLRDVLHKGSITEAILKCEVALKDRNLSFYLIPNNGDLQGISIGIVEKAFKKIENFFDIAILDIPAYQNGEYNLFIDVCDIAILVYNPNSIAIRSVSKAYVGKCRIIPLLNKDLGIEKYRSLVGEFHDKYLVMPFDPYLPLLSPENLTTVLLNLSRKTQESLVELALEILKPKSSSKKSRISKNLFKIGTILRR